MATQTTHKTGRGYKGGEHRKRDGWSGPRDYKSGSSSPGPRRRSNSPWHNNNRSETHKEHRDSQRVYVQYLSEEWKKVVQDLHREPPKDSKITHTVEYIEKTPIDIKADELFNIFHYLKNREEKPPPD